MAKAKTVWGVDIGQMALKALKLRNVDGQLFVEAFDVIEHPKMLCQEDADAEQLINNSLAQFLARNNVAGSDVAVAIPGRSSFTRFVKLPPVEKSKIPDIVQFEAGQQIPFPIAEVVWRYQIFEDPDSPDVEVGLFAVKRVDVFEMLSRFTLAGVGVDMVQMAPLALYNFMIHDEQAATDGATILADIGVDKTDLVVADGTRIWMRTIQIGGSNFTQALEKSFKLSFSKAEKLKRSAATNKYARQVFQAMRPVFTDLVQEIQRSVGYYTQKNRDTKFTRLLGMGNGFRLPGLQKYLERNLNIPVVRIDSYNKLSPSSNVNMPVFTENVLSFATAYGLALQAAGEAPIATNLLPREVSRKRCWDRKRLWFAGSAAAVLLAAAGPMYSAARDGKTFDASIEGPKAVTRVVRDIEEQRGIYKEYDINMAQVLADAEAYKGMYDYRSFWPSVQAMLSDAVKNVTRQHSPLLIGKENRERLKAIPRRERKLIFLESMQSQYYPELADAASAAATARGRDSGEVTYDGDGTEDTLTEIGRGFMVTIIARTPMDKDKGYRDLIKPLLDYLRENSEMENVFKVARENITWSPLTDDSGAAVRRRTGAGSGRGRPPVRGGGRGAPGEGEEDLGPENPSELFPDEDISDDTRFTVTLLVEIAGDKTDNDKADSNTTPR